MLLVALPLMALAASSSIGCASRECRKVYRFSVACMGKKGVHYIKESNVICFNDKIDVEGKVADQFLNIVPRKGVTVVAAGPGGSLISVLKIISHLEKFNYNIIVDKICGSACGQFLFLGAHKKYIIGKGAIGIHGGPLTEDDIEQQGDSPEGRQNLRYEMILFRKFYTDRNINMDLITVPPKGFMDYLAKTKGVTSFWIPSEADFAKYGVKRVKYYNAAYRNPHG